MRINQLILLVLLTALFSSCGEDGPFGFGYDSDYKELGRFKTREEAEQQALLHLSTRYASLPLDRTYKVAYSFIPVATERYSHAIWYNKRSQNLAMEYDKPGGPSCSWDSINNNILQKVVNIKRGLGPLDSLAKPKSQSSVGTAGYSTCFF